MPLPRWSDAVTRNFTFSIVLEAVSYISLKGITGIGIFELFSSRVIVYLSEIL